MEIIKIAERLWLVNGVKVLIPEDRENSPSLAVRQFLESVAIDIYHVTDRRWLVGQDIIEIPEGRPDTEEMAVAIAYPEANGPIIEAHRRTLKTYKIKDFCWMIDGEVVALPRTGDDSEEKAVVVLAEAKAIMQ